MEKNICLRTDVDKGGGDEAKVLLPSGEEKKMRGGTFSLSFQDML